MGIRRGINPLPLKFRLTQRTYLHVRDENSSHRVSIIILANNHETLNTGSMSILLPLIHAGIFMSRGKKCLYINVSILCVVSISIWASRMWYNAGVMGNYQWTTVKHVMNSFECEGLIVDAPHPRGLL